MKRILPIFILASMNAQASGYNHSVVKNNESPFATVDNYLSTHKPFILKATNPRWIWVDNAIDFLPKNGSKIINFKELSQKAPIKYSLQTQPWSDTYWPTRSGQLAWRYSEKIDATTFKEFYDYSHELRPTSSYQGNDRNNLSPAEKYDLLVGDKNFSLTNRSWIAGQLMGGLLPQGSVPDWVGICHGWALAAYNMPRPIHSVTVKDANGEDLTFYPSDIKALGSQLWGAAAPTATMLGRRCSNDFPPRDNSGRVMDESCNDVNPGAFHIAVLNKMGIDHQGFAIEIDPSSEVWNQPAAGYELSYFNPETGETFSNPNSAIINLSNYTSDPYSQYRDPKTISIIGIKMKFHYLDETDPSHKLTDSDLDDLISTETYSYDLELDSDGNIIGGEWHNQLNHPDYIWATQPGEKAISNTNGKGSWNINDPIPTDWQDLAPANSGSLMPISSIVYTLFDEASKPQKTHVSWKELKVNNLCLDVSGSSNKPNASVITFNCTSNDNQQWNLTANGELHPKHAQNLCLQNNTLQLCNQSPEQRWHIQENKLINGLQQQLTAHGYLKPVSVSQKGSDWSW
ncbi:ricin-type beta-trefoil lectin domain protein [Photobacterium damselae subsp. damselae]|uniref:ricin-type beta-trefoil lectin domain protein n=1 Tax=Photobacterium damselae TaxID=38293 RepID=UPI001F1770B1|nr:ricin-type beta-trefoil lectin domain protein [Photobacterium damselae]UJZ95075.1 ricin-type beta-trefoil lectin domain protein [Photobacterium damselae subsp. damselae]UJZ99056.1 ricin-type beta-trefoil lectin domain protein [Photobacterium damselae subsp. damselae]UKA11313.1 ricin-type beta-trefoil lectin domain protein [Photobacterium damselae subsp. damselae]